MAIRFLTAGESHGPALVGIIEGLPAGLSVSEEQINRWLTRRQGGYGRGKRMSIEADRVRFLSGLRFGKTTGAPLALLIENRDRVNWEKIMPLLASGEPEEKRITAPRPGHADLPGGIKYLHGDLRDVLERASARETALRVAVGAVASLLLDHFSIKTVSFVSAIGAIKASAPWEKWDAVQIEQARGASLYCPDRDAEKKMIKEIERAGEGGDSLGGVFEVHVEGVPVGLGSYVHWDRRLDAALAGALMSIPGVKGVEIGLGFGAAEKKGSQVHDQLFLDDKGGLCRRTNRAGGLEGGVTNGETIVLRAAMKPIPTLQRPLSSVDLATGLPCTAAVERADICAVPAASVVGEAAVAWTIAGAFLEKFPGDSIRELETAYRNYQNMVEGYLYKNNDKNKD